MGQGRERARGGTGGSTPAGRPSTLPARVRMAVRRRWPRLALLGVVLAVALGVLAMHQLTHPMPTGHQSAVAGQLVADEPAADHGVADRPDVEPVRPDGSTGMTAAGNPAQHDGGPAGCAACGDHPAVMVLCVLALGLLVLVWRLPRPRLRLAPPSGRLTRPFPLRVVRRKVSWSRAELSVYRI